MTKRSIRQAITSSRTVNGVRDPLTRSPPVHMTISACLAHPLKSPSSNSVSATGDSGRRRVVRAPSRVLFLIHRFLHLARRDLARTPRGSVAFCPRRIFLSARLSVTMLNGPSPPDSFPFFCDSPRHALSMTREAVNQKKKEKKINIKKNSSGFVKKTFALEIEMLKPVFPWPRVRASTLGLLSSSRHFLFLSSFHFYFPFPRHFLLPSQLPRS